MDWDFNAYGGEKEGIYSPWEQVGANVGPSLGILAWYSRVRVWKEGGQLRASGQALAEGGEEAGRKPRPSKDTCLWQGRTPRESDVV